MLWNGMDRQWCNVALQEKMGVLSKDRLAGPFVDAWEEFVGAKTPAMEKACMNRTACWGGGGEGDETMGRRALNMVCALCRLTWRT
jgi:hypothetical protein